MMKFLFKNKLKKVLFIQISFVNLLNKDNQYKLQLKNIRLVFDRFKKEIINKKLTN